MSKVLVNETSLNGIAAAIREKNGETTKYKPSEMAAAISALVIGGGGSGEGDLPEELFNITGECAYLNYKGQWDNFFETFEGKVKITGITSAEDMFENSELKKIPAITGNGNSVSCCKTFYACRNVEEIGKISNININRTDRMFQMCDRLRTLPDMTNVNFNAMNTSTSSMYSNGSYMFSGCCSLRSIDPALLNKIYNLSTSSSYTYLYNLFSTCYVLDEINGIYPTPSTITSNYFVSTFEYCHRLKNITFATQDNGNPYIRSWKSQTISLYDHIGWAASDNNMTRYNSGITIDKKVVDDATYQALKNDPDWYTGNVYYSRYNHTSAVETINSLPDTSEYLATQSGGTNTIKFREDAGALTDGGKVGDLTEEEIAVATAKGWSIVYAV